VTRIAFTIIGQAASKANSRELVKFGERLVSIKSKAARTFERDALRQIPAWARQRLEGPVRVTLHVFYASERPDLDESVVLDVLQDRYVGTGQQRQLVQAGVYRNDRQVREKHVFWGLDRVNPRVEVVVEPVYAQQRDMLAETPEAEPLPF
jgi:Holliday junction resolvase RusA-like endonuclease